MKNMTLILIGASLLGLTGCATTGSRLFPIEAEMLSRKQTLSYDRTNNPYLSQSGQNADVEVGPSLNTGYLSLDIIVTNKTQEVLEIGSDAVTLLKADNVVVMPVSMREVAYRMHGVVPPEEKDTGYKAFETGMTFLTMGIFAVGEAGNQSAARDTYNFLTQHAFNNFKIPPGAKANGLLFYSNEFLFYPIKVVVNVKGEKFEFSYARGN